MATYSPSTGNTQPSDCLNCTAGEYCGDYNLTATSGEKIWVNLTLKVSAFLIC